MTFKGYYPRAGIERVTSRPGSLDPQHFPPVRTFRNNGFRRKFDCPLLAGVSRERSVGEEEVNMPGFLQTFIVVLHEQSVC